MFELIRLMDDDVAIPLLEKIATKHKVRIKGSLKIASIYTKNVIL